MARPKFRVIACEQGSEEWFRARAGVITASMFTTARSRTGGLDERQQRYVWAIRGGKSEAEARELGGFKAQPTSDAVRRAIEGEVVGMPSSQSLNYAFRLAIERISGEPLDEGHSTWQMERGQELEPEARAEHQIQSGMMVDRAGFVVSSCGRFGASADGLIEDDGGSEYKCLVSPERLRTILIDGDWSDFRDQVQGCMWLTGRAWWHLGFYCPQLRAIDYPLHVIEVRRDEAYIADLHKDLLQFNAVVESNVKKLRRLAQREDATA